MELQGNEELKEMFMTSFNIPKIELHAHLFGCIRPTTFLELAERQGVSIDHIDFYNVNMKNVWEIFKVCN